MKNYILALITIGFFAKVNAQTATEVIPYSNDSRVITTGVPFLLIASDARAAGMGDIGVATSVDAYSQQWNPAKYAFSETKSGIGVSYTPYLSKLVNDIFLGNVTYFNRINERSAFAASFKYFSLGEIEIVQDEFSTPLLESPNELTIDASYSLRLADQFSMAVALRYLRSDLRIQAVDQNASAAGSFGVDIAGFYQSEEEAYNDFNGRWRAGFAIQNLGPKIKYDDAGRENFLPTNLRLGGGFDFIFDDYNRVNVTAEVTKLLVPTPPILGVEREFNDLNGNGTFDPSDENPETIISETDDVIIEGQSTDVSFISGVFQSFGDAPGGFSEELKEFTWALGAEYLYQDSFAFRAGYFNESEEKGARKFFALGAGFKYTTINIDLSYLFSASKVQSPLENTLRFSLTFNFGDGEYSEY
ncbi:type IX secretion system outer membrane channel protein PorV [Pontimicrobium sp. IMCC45349]|uniref:type IX secretion system outer membrane channel protein PorV n=1 Tax=Pontimicrobium sp. IMCC45349 TaxID=3391574 RepID=UPI0039A2BD12